MSALQNLTTLNQTLPSSEGDEGIEIELKQLSNVFITFKISARLIVVQLPYLVDEKWNEKSLEDKWEEIKIRFGRNFTGFSFPENTSTNLQDNSNFKTVSALGIAIVKLYGDVENPGYGEHKYPDTADGVVIKGFIDGNSQNETYDGVTVSNFNIFINSLMPIYRYAKIS